MAYMLYASGVYTHPSSIVAHPPDGHAIIGWEKEKRKREKNRLAENGRVVCIAAGGNCGELKSASVGFTRDRDHLVGWCRGHGGRSPVAKELLRCGVMSHTAQELLLGRGPRF